jgi:restriction system protein
MAIPDYQTIMLPLLRVVGNIKSISTKDAVCAIGKEFSLTEEEMDALLPSGNQEIIINFSLFFTL